MYEMIKIKVNLLSGMIMIKIRFLSSMMMMINIIFLNGMMGIKNAKPKSQK